MLSDSLSPVIACFAHPDDEFAVFAWIEQAQRARRKVYCIWLTDGGWGGQSTERRRLESMRVLQRMGVPASRMCFLGEELGVPDGGLHLRVGQVAAAAYAHLADLAEMSCDVLVPAWEGGHPDHDASHLIGLYLGAALSAHVWQYPLYNGYMKARPFFSVLKPLPGNGNPVAVETSLADRFRYVSKCFAYRSQWKSFIGLLPLYALRLADRNAFVLQAASISRTRSRPHCGTLLYERRNSLDWERFAEVTGAFRHELGLLLAD